MKKILYCSLVGCFLGLTPSIAQVQNVKVVNRGDSVQLSAPEGNKMYQWQVSSDGKSFYDIPKANSQNVKIRINTPGYYRTKGFAPDWSNVYTDTIEVQLAPVDFQPNYSVSGGAHGFVESLDGKAGASGISVPEDRNKDTGLAGTSLCLTKWTNGNAMVSYYFHHPKSIIDTEMFLKVKPDAPVTFRISVWDPAKMDTPLAEGIASLRGTGETESVKLIGLEIPHEAYFRYQLECLSGWDNIIEISKFHHHSTSAEKTYKSAYLSSPSVHLSGWYHKARGSHAPEGAAYNWCYEEVMMPKNSDIPGTYIMSLGVLKGYMGIQMNGYQNNGEPLHDVIFSMWDDGDTDKNPDLPDNLRSKAVDHGPGVYTERFGNEGTGIKSFLSGNNWNCDTFVQFITNCRPEEASYKIIENGKEKVIKQTNTLVSAWYNAQDGRGWQYMATLRLANKSKLFDSWYSFLENYNYPTGQILRKGYYRNGYAHAMEENKWYHFNHVHFGHTDGAKDPITGKFKEGVREDLGQGRDDEHPDTYFMTTGGFIPMKQTLDYVVANKVHTPVDTINLDALLLRVDQAIANEKKKMDEEENFKHNKLDKSNWEMLEFTDEEKEGEPDGNGLAKLIIDGNNSTYWHSQWKGTAAPYPHSFVIDMKKEHNVNGVQILMSGGEGRHIKGLEFYTSVDNVNWTLAYSENQEHKKDLFHFMLPKIDKVRYIKLVITGGNTNFVRINEIEVTEGTLSGIGETSDSMSDLEISTSKHDISLKSPVAATNAEVTIHRIDGACLSTNSYPALAEGEKVSIPMMNASKGIYVITFKAGQLNVSKQFMWN